MKKDNPSNELKCHSRLRSGIQAKLVFAVRWREFSLRQIKTGQNRQMKQSKKQSKKEGNRHEGLL